MATLNKSQGYIQALTSAKTISPQRSLARWLKEHHTLVWWMLFTASMMPGGYLVYRYWAGDTGANPLQYLQHASGQIALSFLLISLSITPLRRFLTYTAIRAHAAYGKRLEDWNWIIRLRRMLGLYCFFYTVLHVFCFLHFDIAYDLHELFVESKEKSYLALGMSAALLLMPLAATSTNGMMRRLGKNWRRLHRSVYLIAVLAIAHYWLTIKPGLLIPWLFTGFAALLLLYRLWAFLTKKSAVRLDDGMEAKQRS